jgi:hypothetical protein
MRISKSVFVPGRLFLIPLKADGFGIGQIVENHGKPLGAYSCLFFSKKLSTPKDTFSFDDLSNRLISIQFVTPDLLWNGHWDVLSIEPVFVPEEKFISRPFQQKGSYVGANVVGSGNITEFLSAWHGQKPWNMVYDPEYFDKLLLENVIKPNSVFYKAD